MTALMTTGLAAGLAVAAPALPAQPAGTRADIRYADTLWQTLIANRLAGDGALMSTPYTGAHPHGAILDTIDTRIMIEGQTGVVIVKRNYAGDGVSKQTVADDPARYLKAVTVMFQRRGYDPDNRDWFWAKFLPDGTLDRNPAGISLAGRVGKGADAGCIACHKAAPGGDLVFNNDRFR